MLISFHILCPIASLQLKTTSTTITLVHSSPCWGKMWFSHHSPCGRHSLPNSSTITPLIANVWRASSIATSLPPTCSLSSTYCPPLSNKSNLENSSITTTVGLSFLPLGHTSRLFLMLSLSSMYTTTLFLNDFLCFQRH